MKERKVEYNKVQVWIGAQKKVLIFRVLDSRGGGWHPVTGSVEKHEAVFEGAKRETFEETGLSAPDDAWIDLQYRYVFHGQWGAVEEYAYGLILPIFSNALPEVILEPQEHSMFEWVSVEEAQKRLTFPDQKRALELFSCYLK